MLYKNYVLECLTDLPFIARMIKSVMRKFQAIRFGEDVVTQFLSRKLFCSSFISGRSIYA